MNKVILKASAISILAFSGLSTITINHPNIYASTKSFPKEVQGKWTNQDGDTFKIKGSKATLNIDNGKKKGTYKFKLKSKIDEGIKLKADGKKLDKTNDYTISIFQDGTMQFNYGKQTIKLSNGPVNAKKDSTSKSNAPTQNAQQTNNQQHNNQTQAAGSQNVQQSNANNQLQQNNYENSDHNSAKFYDETDGTYHAPGSNPDGTPDPWVQGQLDWLAQHPEENNATVQDDGTVTQN